MFDIINVYFLLIVKALFNKFVYCLYSPFLHILKVLASTQKRRPYIGNVSATFW